MNEIRIFLPAYNLDMNCVKQRKKNNRILYDVKVDKQENTFTYCCM